MCDLTEELSADFKALACVRKEERLGVSRKKKYFLCCNFSSKYLRSEIADSGNVDWDTTSRTCIVLRKCEGASGLLCDRRMTPRMKGIYIYSILDKSLYRCPIDQTVGRKIRLRLRKAHVRKLPSSGIKTRRCILREKSWWMTIIIKKRKKIV